MFINYARITLKHWIMAILSLFTLCYAYYSSGFIRYGMDLQGGVCVTFTAKDSALQRQLNLILQDEVKQYLSDRKIPAIVTSTDNGVLIKCNSNPYIKMKDWLIQDVEGGLLVNYTNSAAKYQQDIIFEQIYSVIRVRADEQGTSGVSVYSGGNNSVIVEMPGAKNPEELKRRLGSTGKLTFKIDDSANAFVDGGSVKKATVSFDEYGRPLIHMKMNRKGARDMKSMTQNNVGKVMKIYLSGTRGDQEIFSATVQSVLSSDIQITGLRSGEEAQEITLMIKSGALPVPLEVIQERVVGAELGSDAAYLGILTCFLAILLVLGLMFAVYGAMGIIANIALIINIAAIIIFIALTEYNLTLPGIAGIALSAGMAVDANVLINESMRKAIADGKSWQVVLNEGYQNALRTIWDSNLTTLIAGLILYLVGSGIIRAFAVIFAVGLVISFFTSVVLTKAMMEVSYGGNFETPISNAASVFSLPFKISLCGLRKWSSMLSLIAICSVTTYSLLNGIHWGIDFKGGVTMEIISPNLNITTLREKVGDLAAVQECEKDHFLIKTDSNPNADIIMSRLNYDAECIKKDMVGPKLGNELLSSCWKAILLALVCMWIYVTLSFGVSYANVGVICLIHDIFWIMQLYTIFGMEFDSFAIAVILQTIGYSINNTIVIFDQIRKQFTPEKPLPYIVWNAIHETLRRTLLTSMTTAAALIMICFGGSILYSFALPMLYSVIIGTYSSICLAGPYLALIGIKHESEEV